MNKKLKAKAYKYKLDPTFKQQHFTTKSAFDLGKELTTFKKQEGYEWLDKMAIKPLQFALKNVDAAFVRFFREKKGFPKFKSKKQSKPSAQFIGAIHFDFDNWKVKVPVIGWVKIKKSRVFDITKDIGTLTISQNSCGEYFCSILVYDVEEKSKAKISDDTAIGIDLGIKDYAILSDGTKYGNPKFLEKGQKKLKKLQQLFARTQKNSKRHEQLRLKVAKCHKSIANRRNDFINKLTALLIDKYDTICLEDLNVEGLLKNHCLAKNISSVAWSEFVRQLQYKSDWYGKNVIFIGRFEPSSKTCSKCGYIKNDLKLGDREWICPVCGEHHDRDINAAVNIKQMALEKQNLIGY